MEIKSTIFKIQPQLKQYKHDSCLFNLVFSIVFGSLGSYVLHSLDSCFVLFQKL